MAIDFRCSQCGKLLRTGDETAGKQAQCPECQAITVIPSSARQEAVPTPGLAPLGRETTNAGGTPGSPFGPVGGYGPAFPYQPSAFPNALSPAQRVAGPATALIVMAVLGIIGRVIGIARNVLMLTVGGVMAVQQPQVPGPEIPEWLPALFDGGIGLVVGLVGLAMTIVVLIGAIKMLNLRSYAFAMTAAILALIPCAWPCCCPLALPFGIWALVVLGDSSVKAAFHH